MEFAAEKQEWAVLKVVLWGGGSLIVLIALAIGGTYGYRTWSIRHSVRMARGYFNGGDYRLAALSARHAIDIDPNDVDAAQIMAEVSQRSGDKAELDWRRRIVQQRPTSSEKLLELADCALRLKDLAAARQALQSVNDSDKQTPHFIATQARMAAASNDKVQAEKFWARAAELAPQDSSYKLELALAKLAGGDSAKRDSARAVLQSLHADPKQRAAATRALINDAVAHHERAELILEWARDLQSYPEAVFQDRLVYLDMLHQIGHADFISYLSEVENIAPEVPVNLAALLSWMNRSRLSSLALDFARSLPPAKLQAWPVPMAVADSYANVNRWDDLERSLTNAKWNQFDFLRSAYLSRAYRAQDRLVVAEREWAEAVKGATTDPQKLLLLVRAVSEWRWEKETDILLWQLAKIPETQGEALHTLYQQSVSKGDTPKLYSTLVRMAEVDPSDLTIQNNLALVALLLNVDTDRAHKIAATLHEKEPTNAAFASTYAFSLFSKSKAAQALQTMASFPDDQLRDPSLALYYGIFLAANGQTEEARKFLEIGKRAPMLPEEKVLFQRALGRLSTQGGVG